MNWAEDCSWYEDVFWNVCQLYRVGAVAALGPVEAGENIGSCSRSLCSSLSPPFCSVGIPLLLLLHCNLDNPTLLQIVQGNALCLVGISMLLYFAAAIWEGRGVSGKQADARSWISQAARTGSQGLDTKQRCSNWSIWRRKIQAVCEMICNRKYSETEYLITEFFTLHHGVLLAGIAPSLLQIWKE